MAYASGTSVSIEKSVLEIESTLDRFGANKFAYLKDREAGWGAIQFSISNLNIEMKVHLPDKDDDKFKRTPGRRQIRTPKSSI